jgi:hypothetical protein
MLKSIIAAVICVRGHRAELFRAARDLLRRRLMRGHVRPADLAYYWAALFFLIGTALKLLGYQ